MQLGDCFEHKIFSILVAQLAIQFPWENKMLEESLKAFYTFVDAQTCIILPRLSCCSQPFLVGVLTHQALSPLKHLRKPLPAENGILHKQAVLLGGFSPETTALFGFIAHIESHNKLSSQISNETQFKAAGDKSFHSFCSKDRTDLPATRQQSLYMQALVHKLSH